MAAAEEGMLLPQKTAARPWKGRVALAALASFALGALAVTAIPATISKQTFLSKCGTHGTEHCADCENGHICIKCDSGYNLERGWCHEPL